MHVPKWKSVVLGVQSRCPWAPRFARRYLSLGTAVHCRFPTEMLWHLPMRRGLSSSLTYPGTKAKSCLLLQALSCVPRSWGTSSWASIGPSCMKCPRLEDVVRWTRLRSIGKPQKLQSHALLSPDQGRNCSSRALETFSLLPQSTRSTFASKNYPLPEESRRKQMDKYKKKREQRKN